jgi:multidrug efflux pump subunit AcrA (membrane-fusion protein)
MVAKVLVEAPTGSYDARVTIIDRVIDSASSTFRVRLELPNPNHRIPAGLRCKVGLGSAVKRTAQNSSK